MTIRVFGDNAEDIEEGDIFVAKVRYVEGRKLVELEPFPVVKGHLGVANK